MIVYDDTEASEKVKIYDKGIEVTTREGVYDTLVQYRTGDMLSPKIEQEPRRYAVRRGISSTAS